MDLYLGAHEMRKLDFDAFQGHSPSFVNHLACVTHAVADRAGLTTLCVCLCFHRSRLGWQGGLTRKDMAGLKSNLPPFRIRCHICMAEVT